jgi:hypothetical protein
MTADLPLNIVTCTQCGGELHPDEGQIFLTCPYCSATIYLDKSQVVFHWYLAPTLDENKAVGALRRWMAGNQTVKDLDQKARVEPPAFEYFPVWQLKHRLKDGQEQILLEPAAATSVSELKRLNLPAGDLRKYDPGLDSQARTPSVPLQAALDWLEGRGIPQNEIAERALVHIPLYTFKYSFGGQPYTAVVEAGTGGTFANIYPAKAEAPYLLAGGLAALVFLCLALLPIFGAAADNASGAGMGLLACTGIGVLAAPALFALAAWVAAKI